MGEAMNPSEVLAKWEAGLAEQDQAQPRTHPLLPEEGKRNILISSALPYVNNIPHLGNIIGCVLSADVFSRYCRLRGYQSLYVCGTDEYGTATETKAIEEGCTPQQISDKYNKIHRSVYDWFQIDFDQFGRTTTAQQTEVAQAIFKRIEAEGKLVEKTVEQLHCGKCDRFLADRYVFGLCPLCGYEDARGDQCDGCSKLLNATELKVFYVWFDAPIGYVSITAAYTPEWEKWWRQPENVEYFNFVGKDNVPFHSVIFPASLIATGDKWTKVNHLCATEYLNYEEAKFSKRLGVGVFGTDAEATGIPSGVWRFYLLYVRPESQDTAFSWDDFALKVNSELLNNLGNFVNRALTFLKNFFDSKVPQMDLNDGDVSLLCEVSAELKEYLRLLEGAKLRDGIRCILNISRLGNQYMQTNEPWVLVKGSEEEKKRGGTVVGLAANLSALLAVLIRPYMPGTAETLKNQLNLEEAAFVLHPFPTKLLNPGHVIGSPKPLFARLDPGAAKEFQARFAGNQKERAADAKTASPKPKPVKTPKQPKPAQQENPKGSAKAMPAGKTNGLPPIRPGAPQWLVELYQNHQRAESMLGQVSGEYGRLCGELERAETPELAKTKAQLTTTVADLNNRLVELEMEHGVPQIPIPDPKRPLLLPDAAKSAAAPANGPTPASDTPKAAKGEKKAKEKKPKEEGKGGGGKGKAAEPEKPVDVSRLDLRVGFIREAQLHPDAESLYVETVDCGDEAPRTVVSGLVKHIPIQEMQQRPVVVLCNLKPAKMRGVESAAMVMCASTPEKVEILAPPTDSEPGDRVTCSSFPGEPDAQLNPKKKVWEALAPDLKTNGDGQVVWKGALLEVKGKPITSPSLKNVQVK